MWFLRPNVKSLEEKNDVLGLINALNCRDWRVERAALEALCRVADARAVPALVMRLLGRDCDVAGALVRIGAPAVEALLSVLSDGTFLNRDKHEVAARVLGDIGDPRAVELLAKTLGQQLTNVPEVARDALVKIGSASVPALISVLNGKLIRNPLPRAVQFAAEACGRIRDVRAVPLLIATMQYGCDYHVRIAAATALGQIGERSAVPELIVTIVRDNELPVRIAATTALGEIADPTAIKALETVKADTALGLQHYAEEALGKIAGAQRQ